MPECHDSGDLQAALQRLRVVMTGVNKKEQVLVKVTINGAYCKDGIFITDPLPSNATDHPFKVIENVINYCKEEGLLKESQNLEHFQMCTNGRSLHRASWENASKFVTSEFSRWWMKTCTYETEWRGKYYPTILLKADVDDLDDPQPPGDQGGDVEKFEFDTETLKEAVDEWCNAKTRAEVETKYGPIEEWNVTKVESMESLFEFQEEFNADISKWEPKRVTNMSFMFDGATAFNQNLNGWKPEFVVTTAHMFQDANAFELPNVKTWAYFLPKNCKMTDMFDDEEDRSHFRSRHKKFWRSRAPVEK